MKPAPKTQVQLHVFALVMAVSLASACGRRHQQPEAHKASAKGAVPADRTAAPAGPNPFASYRERAQKIADASRDGAAYRLLAELCDTIGARPEGSEALDKALRWAQAKLEQAGHSKVAIEPVQVRKWTRGAESLELLEPRTQALALLALGGSVGTAPEGVSGELVVAESFDELGALGERARGKIVLLNAPMPAYDPATRDPGYGAVLAGRTVGPSVAGSLGASAFLVRSLTSNSLGVPHAGALHYRDGGPRIPAAAVSVEDAELLARLAARGPVRVRLELGARDEGMVPSGNVVAQIDGRELPDQVVVMGGHVDSWDVGQGAADNGAGVVISMQALNLLRRLGLTPRRTLRAVLWTNEETELAGAHAYAAAHQGELHVAAIESDTGGARVLQLNVEHPDEVAATLAQARLRQLRALLEPLGVDRVDIGFSGADLEPLREKGTPGIGLTHDLSHYFDVHHSAADTLDKLDPAALDQSVAVLAITAYVLADMPGKLIGE